jgi:hypothetical protein
VPQAVELGVGVAPLGQQQLVMADEKDVHVNEMAVSHADAFPG